MSLRRRVTAGMILARANLQLFERPDRLARSLLAMAPWGTTLPGVLAAAAGRYPDRVAIHDDEGSLTYGELWDRAQRVAGALLARGVGDGTRIGLLARNHRGFVEWLVGASATGADVVLLNTGFAAPQLAAVVRSEGITLIVHDDDFTDVVADSGVETFDEAAMAALAGSDAMAGPLRNQGRMVILTSGTTGQPKGAARRSDPAAIEGVAAVLERIPFRLGDTQVIAAPLFHGWGLTNLLLGLGRCTTNVLSRRFDAEATLRATSTHGAEVLVVVPVMLSRILALDPQVLVAWPTPRLRVIASSGSALGSRLATAALERFGPVLYNLYGSTEVAIATIATPADLLEAPATAGRVAFGVRVEILDEHDSAVPDGEVGRVFVGGSMRFEGYTTGGGKEERRGLLSSGDLGFFRNGLLFVEGREDDMIVSGGENVFPGEVEDLLSHHPSVAEVAVVGVADDDFGQVLAAFVVPRPGTELSADAVRAHVRDQLARHKVPRRVEFLDELPRNTTGKILRRELAERRAPPDGDMS
jgi:fatty-acyl-CoA synthase